MHAVAPDHIKRDERLQAVYAAMNAIAPLDMADSSWDNVGVQIQAPDPANNTGTAVMLCEDLTTAVVDEALGRGDVAVIVTYHPIIFRGLKCLTLADTQQRSLLRLTSANISVYAAHTSLDACTNGINDWLARIVAGSDVKRDTPVDDLCAPIEALKTPSDGHPNAGMGRLVMLERKRSVQQLVDNLKRQLSLSHVIVGIPRNLDPNEQNLSSVAVAAGSAGSIVSKSNAQAYLTGEMSHHEVLATVERGVVVILTLHGNSERAYLRQVLCEKLQRHLGHQGSKLHVVVSSQDKEPLEIM